MSKHKSKKSAFQVQQKAWLAAKCESAAAEGYTLLPSGVLYRWIERGSGPVFARPSDIVYVHYTGRLTDGTVFDTTEGQPLPACFVVRELIMGWQIALTRMKAGDHMEVIIPAEYGYGKQGALPDIPGHAVLIFDLQLLKVEPH